MIRSRLLWRLFSLFLLIGLSSLLVISWYGSRSFKDLYITETAQDLRHRSRLIMPLLIEDPDEINAAKADSICKKYGELTLSRFTVILPDGRVIGDTEANPPTMDNHSDRPEIIEALRGKIGQSIRYSHTLDTDMLYVAVPLRRDRETIAVIRTSVPLTSLEKALSGINRDLLAGSIIMALLIAIASYLISRKISGPLEVLKKGAGRFAMGDLDHKIHVTASEELKSLAAGMNDMALELKKRIADVEKQRNEKEAVFASMFEGVLAVDLDEKIIIVNKAAADLLEFEPENAYGHTVQEKIRNARLQMLIGTTLNGNEIVVDEITLYGDRELYLQVRGSPLVNSDNEKIGALIVLENITRMKKLENIRRDFVANVSHELKTPITSIKGYIETISDNPELTREEKQKFFDIIKKHTDRLGSIIDDLLQLSKVEQEFEKGTIFLQREMISTVIENAIQFCHSKAEQKNIELNRNCPTGLEANINSQKLEQAVINLIDNAINYSHQGGRVDINAKKTSGEVIIEVRDDGIGIESEHLTRLFERFYRVDKSRSRDKGGTGLGLSIVKHIALVHGGHVSVYSVPDRGSAFRIHLPV